MVTEKIDGTMKQAVENLFTFIRWALVALVTGLLVGGAGSLFYYSLRWATAFRQQHPQMLFLLPVAGLAIVFLYHLGKSPNPKGTNLVIQAVRADANLPGKMAPLIFLSTLLTHLFGGSAGREGAALQLGGSLGTLLGRLFRLDEAYKNIIIMCGMSAAFAALFGTPIAATIFSMELVNVGVMYYAALVPCALAAVVASMFADWVGVPPEQFHLAQIPQVNANTVIHVLVLAVLCACISILMCFALHQAEHLFARLIPNQYFRAAVGGLLIIGMVYLFGTRDYLGAGMDVVEHAICEGEATPTAFLLKILFTAVTLGAGYKGGEIVPAFFVGATFGCLVGHLIGLEPSFAAALGLVAVFCGVTNCPLTALLMSFELFGFSAPSLFLLVLAVSYMLSGYYSLYSAQKIIYGKTAPTFVDRPAH